MDNTNLQDQYREVIEKIIEISKTSTKENSILYNISVNDNNIQCNVSIVDQLGNSKILFEQNIEIKNKFYYFLTPLIKSFSENNKILFTDFVDIDADNYVTFRLLTENNDLLTIDKLTFEDTSYVRDLVQKLNIDIKDKKELNEKGSVNNLLVITLILITIVVLVVVLYLM